MYFGDSFGYSNYAHMVFDIKNQMSATDGFVKLFDGTTYAYRTITDYHKESIWTISNNSCTWAKQEGNMGTTCIGENNGETVFYGSFNYMGYIPTYTWRTTIWMEKQKGFFYISVTEDECLPVTLNFNGYNDQVVPIPETVFQGGNFYNYTSGIHPDDLARYFDVPYYCPPAPPPDVQKHTDRKEDDMFAPARALMNIKQMIRRARMK
ncbi:uncharacterized protein [Amphiura filiformis]|uniref:uncharacterized protein n=1 Tax=Amphiura filiformis TaxID=82378 RepID=UPI003B21BE25